MSEDSSSPMKREVGIENVRQHMAEMRAAGTPEEVRNERASNDSLN